MNFKEYHLWRSLNGRQYWTGGRSGSLFANDIRLEFLKCYPNTQREGLRTEVPELLSNTEFIFLTLLLMLILIHTYYVQMETEIERGEKIPVGHGNVI